MNNKNASSSLSSHLTSTDCISNKNSKYNIGYLTKYGIIIALSALQYGNYLIIFLH